MKKFWVLGALAVLLVVLTSCAAGPNELTNFPSRTGDVDGFWMGLWHGVIAPVTLVISLFVDNVRIYEVHNNGNWYNFGFVLGIALTWGSSGGAASRRFR